MSNRVLVVDDEPNFLAAVRRGLRGRFDVTTVESGEEALRAIAEAGPFSVVLCDMQMPRMNGIETLRRIRELTPDTVRMMLTGNADQGTAVEAINEGRVYRFLSKPCPTEMLAQAIDSAIKVYQDAAAERAAHERLRRLSDYDFLTDLPNRVLMAAKVDQAMRESARAGRRLALLMVDLDRFTVVNEALGYACGDELLKQIADRLLSGVRATDVVSRLGGDVFLVLADDITAVDNATTIAETLLRRLRQPYRLEAHLVDVTASIGIVTFPEDGASLDELLKNAETAIRAAKSGGGDTLATYAPEMSRRSRSRLWLQTGLKNALQTGALQLFFQPQFELPSRRLIGCEALVRWHHDGGMIPPADFIPVAEESGLIVPLGDWIVAEAIRSAAIIQRWRPVSVAINLSPIQLRQPGLAGRIAELAAGHQVPVERLEFEVTEGVLMDGSGGLATLARLRQAGAALSIDDFGTGYSNLAYLKRFRVDKLKIDRTFVEDITANPESEAIARAIIGMARSLGIRTIAEGVETDDQLDALYRMGCQEIQGFLLGRPVCLEEFLALHADLP